MSFLVRVESYFRSSISSKHALFASKLNGRSNGHGSVWIPRRNLEISRKLEEVVNQESHFNGRIIIANETVEIQKSPTEKEVHHFRTLKFGQQKSLQGAVSLKNGVTWKSHFWDIHLIPFCHSRKLIWSAL
jgi:hypothetical protein